MDKNKLKLYRRRYMPDEIVYLKDDIILYADEDIIKTKWNVLKPRKDFSHGISWYYIKKGWKISSFFRSDGSLLYYYCDIIDVEYDKEEEKCVVNDLLADVKIYPDGKIEVVDIDEIADALDSEIITIEAAKKALRQLDSLLKVIYSNSLKDYYDMSANGD